MKALLRISLPLVAFAGCFQLEESATLMPDGSGKLTITFAMKQSTLKMIEEFGKQFGADAPDPMADFGDPLKLKENSEGFAAWSEAKKETEGEWVRLTVSGYFEDVNKARFYTVQQQPGQDKKRTLSFAAKYEKAGDGGKLTPQNEMGEGMKGGPGAPDPNDEVGKAVLEGMKPLFEGMKIAISVTVPGPVDDAGGLPDKKDRTASFTLDSKMLFEMISKPDGETAKKLKALGEKADKPTPIVWSKTTVPPDVVASFKKEMAAAKESWEKRLKDAPSKKKE